MAFLRNLVAGLRAVVQKAESDREMDEELGAYVDAAVEAKLRGGMSREEAVRAARVEMGSAEAVKEGVRDAGWERGLESLGQDIRYGARMLRKSPGFTAIAVLTLALGIGANAAIFSMVYAVLLKPLPYPGASRIVAINESLPKTGYMADSWPDFVDWRKENHVFEQIAVLQPQGAIFTGFGPPTNLPVGLVSSALFPLFGAKPLLGRMFGDADEKPGAPEVAVLSYRFWRDTLHGDRRVVGRTIVLDSTSTTIVGVLPSGFALPGMGFALYLPVGQMVSQGEWAARSNHPGLLGYAKFRRGVSLEMARTDMNTIMARLAVEYPQSNKHEKAILTPLLESLVGGYRQELMLLWAAVGLLLLLACANVAHLALARGIGRQREFAVRAALGGGRARLLRQFLVEHALLALAGGAAGVVLAAVTVPTLTRNAAVLGGFLAQCLGRVRQVPGVESASAAFKPPLEGIQWTSPYEPGTSPPDNRAPWAAIDMVMPDYFQAMGARLIGGRFFTPEDENGAPPIAMVNEAMARTFPEKAKVVGKQIYVTYAPAPQPLLRVVGVVADMKQWSLDTPDMPEVFLPDTQGMVNGAWIVVRTKVDPATVERPALAAIHSVNSSQLLGQAQTFDAALGAGLAYRSFLAFLFGGFSGLALVLAVVDVWGGMAYTVDQRRREIAIRRALGAQTGSVFRLILGQGMLLAGIGITLGMGEHWPRRSCCAACSSASNPRTRQRSEPSPRSLRPWRWRRVRCRRGGRRESIL